MGNIVLLDELTINQIAAGEVIERPANVVKELVENSIDAGARRITIEIKNGGKKYIKVTDNGKGIPKDDIIISLERHATSKIRKVEDLEKIYSMGFRGEALASISAISNITMVSKTKEDIMGTMMILKSGKILKIEELATQIGTSVIVENLFFNTPVRYKFLKQDAIETRYIKDWVQKVALANPNISFKLITDGKNTFFSTGNGKLCDVVYLIYGKEIEENLVKVNYECEDIRINGVIGNTFVARETRKNQILFLNRRNIKNSMLSSAADQAFKGATGIGKYGFFILNLEMPGHFYDINVHPTKMEVRFKEEGKIYNVFYHAIKNAMLKIEFLGNNENTNQNYEYIENEYKFLTNSLVKKEFIENKNVELRKRKTIRKIDYRYIGILFRTYIIIEIENEIFLIDQHAAHERVIYEQIKENYKKHLQPDSQLMIIPEVINLTHREMEFVLNNMKLFSNSGFLIEPFGDNTIKINGMPDLEYRGKTKNIFLDILDEIISSERTVIKDIEERFIATVACKAAVKANMDLNRQEIDKLIQSLLNLNNPYTCPHGRPTTIKFDKNYIEKQLKI